jgi:aconitate decarboxylase
MAREGLTSTTHALDKWIKLISHNDGDTTAVAALADASSEKDRKWMVLENTFKPYPCGIVSHPAIDAGVAAHDYFANNADIAVSGNLPQDALNIFSYIEASVTALTIRLCGVRHPRDAMQTIFSTYHGIAVGLIYGRAGIREYAMDVVNEPLIKEIRNRIRLTADDTLKDNQASLTVGYRGVEAETLRMHFVIKHAIGSLQNPMSEEQLEKKFADQADIGGIDVEAVKRAIEDLWNLEIIEDIAYTMKYFVPQPISNRTD